MIAMDRNNSQALVNERKFTAHSLDADRALALVRHFCVPHPDYPSGRVNSIYFDTPDLAAFKEKFDGDRLKRKYRLRWYDTGREPAKDSLTAFLEIKYRIGSARDKRRHRLQADAAWLRSAPLNDPSLVRFLRQMAPQLQDNIPLRLRPAICIVYDRHRFVCYRTGLTVCIDFCIEAVRINPDLFCASVPFGLNTVVCECKTHGFPDIPWADSLYRAGFRIRSFSKYGECVHQALHGGAPTVVRMSI